MKMLVILALAGTMAIFVGAQDLSQPPQFPKNSDCSPQAGHVYTSCEFACTDEAMALNNREPCYLSGQGPTKNGPSPTDRAETEATQGVCVDGACVAKDYVPSNPESLPQPEPVRESELSPKAQP
uniref:Putative secreted protein n=1 Tax=Amblyomma triste TaxID=251400 RepID=A0A023G0S2_AMBTT